MIWLDFFLQAFIHALAWICAIVAVVLGLVGIAWAACKVACWWPFGGEWEEPE